MLLQKTVDVQPRNQMMILGSIYPSRILQYHSRIDLTIKFEFFVVSFYGCFCLKCIEKLSYGNIIKSFDLAIF